MVAFEMSVRTASGNAAANFCRISRGRVSSSTPMRWGLMPRLRRLSRMTQM
jgi:hypothetical protein